MTASTMLQAARNDLGMSGRPNPITRDYASRNGREFLEAPWCAMGVTWWARKSGNADAVLPEGDRAFTVWLAEDGRDRGLWHSGTVANIKKFCEPGAIVFFDWGGTNTISKIDHVGVVEKVLDDGRVQTIEGNTGDACKRRIRSADVIAGFWLPPYKTVTAPPPPAASTVEDLVSKLPLVGPGSNSYDVKTVRGCLFARGRVPASAFEEDGLQAWLESTVCDERLVELIKVFQRAENIGVDGWVGKETWPRLLRLK